MATRSSLVFQLPRFVSSRLLGALYRRPSPSTGLQRMLAAATSHKDIPAHSEGDAIVVTSLPRDQEADVAADLLAGKSRAPSPKIRPGKPKENPGRDKHNDVPDKKAKEGKQGTGSRNNYAAAS